MADETDREPPLPDPAEAVPDAADGDGAGTAAEGILRSLDRHGVRYIFANYGTDHTPILEAAARVRADDAADQPDHVNCPHEYVAMSAAHGYAAITGEPQAVLVHVDVGTQNLGSAVHNAFRADVPVFVMAGRAPVSEAGYRGSRDNKVHYIQDVPDQPGVVRGYCRWTEEYRPPADPDAAVARGLTRATAPPAGPVYLSATREALETVVPTPRRDRTVERSRRIAPDRKTVAELAATLERADRPLVVASKHGTPPAERNVESLIEFSEAAGAGVVEHKPAALNFPRDHELHVGFDPNDVLDAADAVVLVNTDVPWLPSRGDPDDDVPVIQVDVDPSKSTHPYWDFRVDHAVEADPGRTLAALADAVSEEAGQVGREHWTSVHAERQRALEEALAADLEEGRFTPRVVADAVHDAVDDDAILLTDAVTNNGAVLNYVPRTVPGTSLSKHGSGLGWAGGAAVGAKMAAPDRQVVAVVGDGAYLFSHPSSTAGLGAAQDAPTLTVVLNNSGWNAVKAATERQHPGGEAAATGVPGSAFDPSFDLSKPAEVVDAHTAVASDREQLASVLEGALGALDAGTQAVVDARIEPI